MSDQDSERRRHRRLRMSFPVSFFDRSGTVIVKGDSIDLSDSGIFVSVPVESMEKLDNKVNLTFSVSRSDNGGFMLEDFACQADVVRQQPLTDPTFAGVAMSFERVLDLALEA